MGIIAERQDAGFDLDEMGKALRERLGRLPQKKSTPYTALSLLKAYGAFQTGICLSLKDDRYTSYASVGLGIEKLSVPREVLWSEEKANVNYFKLDSESGIKVKNAEKDLIYWAFPLKTGNISVPEGNATEPWEALMLLGVQETSDFNPESVSAILDEVADKMVLSTDQSAAEPVSSEPYSAETAPEISPVESYDIAKPSTVEEEIAQFHSTHLDFNCIVLENPCAAGESEYSSVEKDDFCEKVSVMIGKMGTVVPLPSGHPLILFPIVVDRELIAHRLSKTLKTKLLLSFEANNPENASTRLDSLM